MSVRSGLLFAHQLLEHGQQFQLVANVEEGGGFIEHNDLRLLADGAGQQHTLPLSIADAGKIAVGKFIRADKRKRLWLLPQPPTVRQA